jgi:hypothetical protein
MLGVLLFTILILFIIFVSSQSNKKIPKIIWTFWDGSEKPLLVKKCMETWKKWAPDYEIHVLDKESTKHIQKFKRSSDSIQRYTDFVRLDVLSKYGGIWMDASIYLTRSLDWIYEDDSEFIGYKCIGQQSEPDIPVIDSWFLACTPDCNYMKDWYEEFKHMDSFDTVGEYLSTLLLWKSEKRKSMTNLNFSYRKKTPGLYSQIKLHWKSFAVETEIMK